MPTLEPSHHEGDGRHSKSSFTSPWPDFKGPTGPRLKPWTKCLEVHNIVSYSLKNLVFVPRLYSSYFNDFFAICFCLWLQHMPLATSFCQPQKRGDLWGFGVHTWIVFYHSKAPFINFRTYFPNPYDNNVEAMDQILAANCVQFVGKL